jgi:hypothetical protein
MEEGLRLNCGSREARKTRAHDQSAAALPLRPPGKIRRSARGSEIYHGLQKTDEKAIQSNLPSSLPSRGANARRRSRTDRTQELKMRDLGW